MKVLVLGVSGMLGSAVYRVLSASSSLEVYGSVRGTAALQYFAENIAGRILSGVDVENHDSLVRLFARVRPEIVVNCVGLVKQLSDANDPLQAVPINSLLPHRLAMLCQASGARLIHISTDCVFSGKKGSYLETDFPDAYDLYGRSKLIGEVDYPNAITLRTSIIGRELAGNRSLVDWFLSQSGEVRGYSKAIFSGLPTVELANVINQYVIPHPDLHGLYHVAAKPIDKYTLLKLIAASFGREIKIVASDSLVIDRSLNAQRFTEATQYIAPEWPVLIDRLRDFN
ncbi:NAD(P)-dependent oxidoreductase [Pseudomonas plecoglossicida]|uniref:dTDP-4-dehydrorhamnose reductase n=2 Tax=Pseudomonas TaxID=286 RepID=A0A2A3M7B0_PSEDL|nr:MULTISPECIES: SDR family oxidoreductase [Pseudomonas]MDD2109855.1 SDR family oxidoreductase [Pseudomonas asiatica]PBJ95990.1 NAD(P)-dependent oxidoreductase [Pseudomonas plecoglossicida]